MNWFEQHRELIYRLADAMRNVPQALEVIAANKGHNKWAIEEPKQIPEISEKNII
ncbi:hypothetical protein [Pseudomonas sp. S1(2024)]|uniref:hypothetical protein n=1 Tax=Pseudomonas sp. S1(2024) TaxID=3390191 RepID=UPI00397C9F22